MTGLLVAGTSSDAGSVRGAVWGSIWHGTMECDSFRRAFLTEVADRVGSTWRPDPTAPGFGERREAMIDLLADAIQAHLDLEALRALAR